MTRHKTRAFYDSYWGEEETENNVDGARVRRETRNVRRETRNVRRETRNASETSVGIACK